ncbi:manganese efflux pump MntP family protein [Clostridium gasigenes]|uniref:Putative manganese efflux pump MntP n=1 Tax=Clostridium gasigenes TaxID=94869 RepID=A0A1H0LZA1_9CLOT|nr:manganese efflux pump MntP family protein [Clostridium gasigenes]SDO73549.1 Putative Mn2+ efflux pump MntP [Clostridium gasigenes]
MGLLSIFMTAIGLSMDAVAVSIAKGMTVKKNLLRNAIKIALFFGVFQGVMPLIGWFAGRYFENYIKSFDHWIAFILLSVIGGKMIYESLKGNKERKENKQDEVREIDKIEKEDKIIEIQEEVSLDRDICDKQCEIKSEELSHKSLTILAIATSIDALAVGVSFAFLEVSIIPAATIIGLTTFILCIAAVLIGKKLGCILQKYAEIIGGVILIIIGINILIEHLFMS